MPQINTTAKAQVDDALAAEIKAAADEAAKEVKAEEAEAAGAEVESKVAELEKKQDTKDSPYVSVAAEWGWKPKEEFDADPKNKGKQWVEAEEYVRKQRDITESYRKRDKELTARLDETAKIIRNLDERQKAADKRAAEADKRARENIMAEITAKLDEAAEAGDKSEVRRYAEELAALKVQAEVKPAAEELEEEEVEDGNNAVQGKESPTVQRWLGRNEGWYGDLNDPINAALTQFADVRSAELGKEEPNRSWTDIFQILDKEIADKRSGYEQRLAPAKPKRESSAAGGGNPANGNRAKSYNDLTAQEKRACDKFVKLGAFPDRQSYVDAM